MEQQRSCPACVSPQRILRGGCLRACMSLLLACIAAASFLGLGKATCRAQPFAF